MSAAADTTSDQRTQSRAAAMAPYGVLAVLLAVVSILIIFPVIVLVIGSFLSEPPRALHFDWSGATPRNYIDLIHSPGFADLVGTTLVAAVFGTIGAVAIGAISAWLAIRTDLPGRRGVEVISLLPMFVSPLVGAFAWDILASPHAGLINLFARGLHLPITVNIYSMPGIAFVFSIYYAPYAFLLVSAALRNMDATLEEASIMSGAGQVRTMLKVTLPLVSPALLSASLLVFVLLISLFAIPAVLGEPGDIHVVAVRIWDLIGFAPPKVNQASALGVLMMMVTMSLVWLQHRVMRHRSYVTVSGKGLRPRPVELGIFRWPLAMLVFLFLLTNVLMPYAALLLIALRRNLYYTSLATLFDPSQFGVARFQSTLSDPVVRASLRNSLAVGLGTVLIGTVLYFAVAYTVSRTRLRGRRVLDTIMVLPVAIPGLIIGLGYLWSWITIPVGLYGTLWIMILAYVSQFAPQGVRSITGSLVQIHNELEESSRLSGAGFLYTLRRIVVPLSWPGIVAAMTFLLALSFREISTALFLYTADTQVFSVTMFDLWLRGSTDVVAAMALIQTAIILTLVVLSRLIRAGRGPTLTPGN
jgi:iron(III) transport system permease protein